MGKNALIIILCIILVISLGINIILFMLYDYNMDVAHDEYMDLMDYCEELEDIVEEWEVWIP